jgi:hypothetical protein
MRSFGEAKPPNAQVHSRLASEDWDLLLQAVIDRLQREADGLAASKGLHDTEAVLRECAAALNQLGTSAPPAQRRDATAPAPH